MHSPFIEMSMALSIIFTYRIRVLFSTFSDLAAVPVIAQLFLTGPPLLCVYLTWQALKRLGFCGSTVEEQDDFDDEKHKDVGAALSESEDEVPRTPGLLFDPSVPESEHLKQ